MSIVNVHIAASGNNPKTASYTIVVDGEIIVDEVKLEEALPVLDHWTPDRWHLNTVLGNLEAAARDGVVRFSVDPDHSENEEVS